MNHQNACLLLGESGFRFDRACLADLQFELLHLKKPLTKITYDFFHKDRGDPSRWPNWIAGIKQWWFFSDFIGDPEEIGKKGQIEFDLTKINAFEFYSVFSCIRMMNESPGLFNFAFDLDKHTGDQINSFFDRQPNYSSVFHNGHSLFRKNQKLKFNKLINIPYLDPLTDSSYGFLCHPQHSSYYNEFNTL